MNGHIFNLVIIGALMYEYVKRERDHKRIIARLKEGHYPDHISLHKDLTGIVLLSIITVIYFGFLIFLTFFFPMTIPFPFLLLPYGIGGILILVIKRDIAIYTTTTKAQLEGGGK